MTTPPPRDSVRFPYMFWAHTESFRSPYCLSQSGMPAPDASFLEGRLATDLAHPCVEAQPALEARLAELFGVEPERVLCTVGASSAMQVAAMRWFRSGATVVTELPSYEPFRLLPEFYGARVELLERRLEDAWRLDPEVVAARVAGGGAPAHLFLSNPNNPTGALSSAEDIVRLAEIAGATGGVLVSNEVYMEFASPEERIHAFALAPNSISIGSLTKAYGLGALRIGWIVLGEGLAKERDALLDMAYLAYVDPPTLSLRAGHIALDHLDSLLANYRHFEAHSRPHLWRFLKETGGVRSTTPALGLSAFPQLEGIADTLAFAAELAADYQVDVVPGEYFGMPGFVRVGFGVPEGTLVEGLERLGRALADRA